MEPPPVVTCHVWRVARTAPALVRVAADRLLLRRLPGLRFGRVLGTADGFAPRNADPTRWVILAGWADAYAAAAFETGRLVGRWEDAASESWSARLRPCSVRGRWGGPEPFGRPAATTPGGPVLAVTRARLHPLRSRRFRRAVGPVARQLADADGLLLGFGVGEWPVGVQGTLSAWKNAEALRAFAYGPGAHREVVRRTPVEGWYTEELFAHFTIRHCRGSIDGIQLSR